MASNQIDAIDLVGVALVSVFGPMALGVVSFSIKVFGGFSFTDVLWSGSGASLTWAGLLALAGAAWIVFANFAAGDWSLKSMEWYIAATILVAFGIIPLYMFVPLVSDAVNNTDAVALVLALIQMSAGPLLSWEG